MRFLFLLVGWMVASSSGWATDIVDVLEQSQRARLSTRVGAAADSPRAARIRASFERLIAKAPPSHPVELRVMEGGVQAEAMLDRLLVVGEATGDLPENERLLLLAHELSHISLDHWHALCALYRRHIPGEVRPETTDPVAGALGHEAHDLSYAHEYAADAAGYALVHALGVGLDDAVSLLSRQALMHDTATHPATRRRIAQLRALDMRLEEQTRLNAGAPAQRVVGAPPAQP
ncbi:MAG: M48 family metalloprotease [Burkholderiaceae bacterium]